jgi:hypothetical protein
MTAIFGEVVSLAQRKGPDIKLRVFGDEFYARYETEDGYTVIYDQNRGLFVYALLKEGRFISSGIGLDLIPPSGILPHLEESPEVRQSKAKTRFFRD